MLILARKSNERIMIGDDIEIAVVEIRGDQVKLGIVAPESVKVYRREVFDAIQEENRVAARALPGDLSGLSDLVSGKQADHPDAASTNRQGRADHPPGGDTGDSSGR